MNQQAFKTLEFDLLRDLVQRGAQTEAGQSRIKSISPLDDLDDLGLQLRKAAEGITLRHHGVRLSFSGTIDTTDLIA